MSRSPRALKLFVSSHNQEIEAPDGIFGDREGLIALRDAITALLKNPVLRSVGLQIFGNRPSLEELRVELVEEDVEK